LLSEYLSARIERLFLVPALILGIFSVLYWHFLGDLRFYYWVQLTPMITIPVLLIIYPAKYSHRTYLIITLVFYVLAKIVEIFDKEIFKMNDEMLSGHTIKHIFAATGAFFIYQMLKKRNLKSSADIHEKNEMNYA